MSTDRTPAAPDVELLTFREACEYLRLSRATLRRRIEDREISFVRDGRLIRFRRRDLDLYLRTRLVEAEPQW